MKGAIKEQLDSVFDPKSIAFIGASNDLAKWGGFSLSQTLFAGYRGGVYPISRNQKMVQGIPAYPSVLDVPGDVDLAVFTIPAASCPSMMEECAQKGVKAAIVITGGFAEIGQEGRSRQEELLCAARSGNIRVVGPNGMGVWSATSRLCLSTGFNPPPKAGPIAFISQSGSFGTTLVTHASSRGYGFSRFVSAGNQADLNAADYLEYCAEDNETRVIVYYLEGLKDGQRFMEVAREVVKSKPIIIVKSGRVEATKRAMLSHTGSLSGSDEVFSAMCAQVGIIRAKEANQAFGMAEALAKQPLPTGKRVSIMSPGGGFCVAMTDLCGENGLEIPAFDAETQAQIKPLLLPHAPAPVNPIDTAGDMNPLVVPQIAARVADLDNVDGIITNVPYLPPNLMTIDIAELGAQSARLLCSIPKEKKKPLILCGFSSDNSFIAAILRNAGIPICDDAESAARAMAALTYYGYVQRTLGAESSRPHVPAESTAESKAEAMAIIAKARAEGRFSLSEHEGKGVLAAYGIPVTKEQLVAGESELREALNEFALPVVMKVDSPDILHKTEAGVIKLNVGTVDEAVAAYGEIVARAKQYNAQARIDGVLVQEMVTESTECFVGMKRDPQFGPTIMFGLGGIFVEVLKDVTLRIAPLTTGDASRMIRKIKGYKILEGVRGQTPRDVPAIEEVLSRVSQMALDLSEEIEEIDINPLMVGAEGRGAKAVDALIVLSKGEAK